MYKESELTRMIIGIAMQVHRDIGPGFQERIYHNAITIALQQAGCKVEVEKEYDVVFRYQWVGTFRLDLVVNNKIVVELKAVVGNMPKLFQTQTISYLKVTGLEVALLINFGNESLEIKRLARYSNYQKSV